MQLSRSVGAPSRGEHVGTIAIAGQSRRCRGQRRRLGMTGGVGLSVTQRSNGFFLFSDLNE